MSSPYLFDGPAVISFSGGRTSGYMLASILAVHGGKLPDDIVVVFANTGRERLETLDFVRDVQGYWQVPIHWVEYRKPQHRGAIRHEEVDYESASRDGEPYTSLIESRNFLPNPVMRFCTQELKVNTMRDFISRGLGWEKYTNVVGLRADEMNRVAKMQAKNDDPKNSDPWRSIAPMATAVAMLDDVMEFWKQQDFDLQLRPHEGNCDLCFLKGAGTIAAIIREHPELSHWWEKQEARNVRGRDAGEGQDASRFRNDRPSYAEMAEGVRMQSAFDFGVFDDLMTCDTNGCTD
jgi:3'-phosphoadenosine 5'-phosphosulfate sulfotransferase (PAPS reductase)/FAD synthetase